MDDGSPALEVGFTIDTGGSFSELSQLQQAMDSTEARIVADAAKIERATGNMLDLGAAKASMTAFGSAATREGANIARELARVEKAGESLSRALDREASTFGKTRDQIRLTKVETAALAAEQQGLIELATRLRAQEETLSSAELVAARKARFEAEAAGEAKQLAADQAAAAAAAEAKAVRDAAAAYRVFEAVAKQRMTGYRDQQATNTAAQMQAEAAAAKQLATEHERLAAMVRGSHDAQMADAEAAERLRMATDPLYAATVRLNAEIAESTRLYYAGATAPAEYARQQQVLTQRLAATTAQHNAMAVAGGRNAFAMQQLAIQVPDVVQGLLSGQHPMTIFIQQGGQIAQIGMMAEGGLKGFATQIGALALRFAPLLGYLGLAVGAFALFDRSVSSGIDTTAMVNSLGLTHAEIKRLKDTTVDTGDVVTATFEVIAERVGFHLASVKKFFADAMDFMTKVGADALAGLYAGFVGTFDAIGILIRDLKEGRPLDILGDIDKDMTHRFDQARGAMNRFGDDVTKQIKSNKLAEQQKQAADIKADRTPKKPKVDHHAEQLARDAAAVEAQIKNLYALADAYGVSGAAALIAEAREKAESKAIKGRADIEAAVDRQIRLAIAQRVSDAAKSTAAMREQTAIQQLVNAGVASGNILAGQANQFVQDRIADLPLLAAIEAAKQTKDVKGIQEATAALDAQRQARLDAADAESEAARVSAMAEGKDRLAELREELRLVGATDTARVHALATLRAEQDALAKNWGGAKGLEYVQQQVAIADATERLAAAQRDYNDALNFTADKWDLIARNIQNAGQGMADAFGKGGQALGDLASAYASYRAEEERAKVAHKNNLDLATTEAAVQRENAKYALATTTSQIGLYGDLATAAKGFFKEGTGGYKAMADAEKVFRAIQFALSIRAMAQDAIETGTALAKSAARTAANAVEAVTKAIASLPFPLNLVAGAATIAALASIGVAIAGSFGGGGKKPDEGNTGTGTVLGDATAKSDSIKNAIDALKNVDSLTNTYAREMSASLKSIDSAIGGLATVLVRAGDINASAGVNEGFKKNLIGSVLSHIPVIGGLLGSLFGSKTTVVGSGLYGGAQSIGSILSGGFDAQTYSDIQKKKKLFGITTGTKYSTQYGAADSTLENQFTLILKQFDDAILAAAGPLGAATSDIQNRLNGFVVNIGKIDLKGLTGQQIQDKLEAVFGAAADNMANAAFPGIARFQKAGEGAFETLVRVASTVEAVTNALDELGGSTASLSIDAKIGLAEQFDSISDMTSAIDAYFQAFYSTEDQTAAKTAELKRVFDSLGLSMPATLDAFRQMVDAQDLTTAAGQATYATLIKLAPAFADLQAALNGAKSAADIASERADLQRQLLELQGDTAALRQLQLDKLDPSNRALQEQIYAIQDAQDAAKAAQELADAWSSVGDSIMDEVRRIRGLSDTTGANTYASLLGQFNAATSAARGGDMDAAKTLPQLSQSLLTAAENAATSRQELDRIQAQIAASLEATYGLITGLTGSTATISTSDLLTNALTSQPATVSMNDNVGDSLTAKLDELRDEIAQMRSENTAGHAATAGNTGSIKKTLDNVTQQSGGDAITTVIAA